MSMSPKKKLIKGIETYRKLIESLTRGFFDIVKLETMVIF